MTKSEREDAFYKQLEFGTGGMRGELDTEPNRMNIYTIRKVTAGLAKYIEENGAEAKKRGVVIAYDSRHGSAKFALEAADYYKQQEMTLYDGLIELYETYSYYKKSLTSFTVKGKNGSEQIDRIVNSFREHPPAEIASAAVEKIEDYQTGRRINLLTAQQERMDLPSSNALKFWLQDGSWFALRPSGIEPKVKFYFGVRQGTNVESEERLKEIETNVINMVESIIY